MVSGFQILCANKQPSGRIIRVGGEGWSMDIQEAILRITSDRIRFNILIGDTFFEIGVRDEDNSSYLVLEPDGTPLHEVDGLHSC